MTLFLCPELKEFLRDFEKCEKCEKKDKCVEYVYERGFRKQESSITQSS